jgi:hypothetical protein
VRLLAAGNTNKKDRRLADILWALLRDNRAFTPATPVKTVAA